MPTDRLREVAQQLMDAGTRGEDARLNFTAAAALLSVRASTPAAESQDLRARARRIRGDAKLALLRAAQIIEHEAGIGTQQPTADQPKPVSQTARLLHRLSR
jgi:hypothetical protein